MATATLIVTEKPQLEFTDVVRAIHDCPPENQSCDVLYYLAFALDADMVIGINESNLFSQKMLWPTCLLCNRCLVEPEIWRFPLEPHRNLLCAPCLIAAADPPITYMEMSSEEYQRKIWLINEVGSGREPMRPFPADAPAKRTYTGPRDASPFAKIKAAVPVEVLAGRFTDLRPAGPGKLKGCCPLHQESTPSFHIWTEKGTWRCFGACAVGGDVIALAQLLMDRGLLTRPSVVV